MDDRRYTAGFTTLELVITIAVTLILFQIAIPSYVKHMQKVRRTDAVSSLLELQLRQSEWHLNYGVYASLEELKWKSGTGNSLDGYYTITVMNKVAAGYLATATPVRSQVDDACGTFAVNQISTVYADHAGPECWGR